MVVSGIMNKTSHCFITFLRKAHSIDDDHLKIVSSVNLLKYKIYALKKKEKTIPNPYVRNRKYRKLFSVIA